MLFLALEGPNLDLAVNQRGLFFTNPDRTKLEEEAPGFVEISPIC